jgi:pSer/pThr/pTyr-binding forkhead associated (FHA) protein
MLKLVITDDEGRTTVCPLDRDEVTIGRGEGNTIRLTERNVSRKHAVLRRASRGCEIEDLRSYNGTKVGGTKITGRRVVRDGERIQIGDYQVTLQSAHAPIRVGKGGTKTAQITADAETALFALPEDARTAATQAAARARPSGKPRFVVEAGPGRGRQFVLDRDELTMGQAPECEVRLDHASVSRVHAKIVNVGGVRILDLQSTNGVRVNGRDVPYAELEPGDLIELGEVRLRFVVPGAPARPGANAAAGPRTTLLLGGIAAGFVAVALILFVAWPAPSGDPTTTVGATPPAGGASPSATADDSSSKAARYITDARAHQKRGALREAEDAASKAKAILASRGSPTAVADNVLRDLIRERAARAELERARGQAARSPRDALSSLDRIPATTDTASDPAVAQIAADALARLLHDIESRSRQERDEARAQVETLLEYPRLVPATLPAELERVRTEALTLRESLSAQTVAAVPGHAPGKRPGGPRENPRPPPEEVRPATDAQETAAFNRLRSAAASNPTLACQLARSFLRDFPGSKKTGQAHQIVARCH